MKKSTFYKLIIIKLTLISAIVLLVVFQDKIFAKFINETFLHCISYDGEFEVLLNKPGKDSPHQNKLLFISHGKTIASAYGADIEFSPSAIFRDAELANAPTKKLQFEILAAHVHGIAVLNSNMPTEKKFFVVCYEQKKPI